MNETLSAQARVGKLTEESLDAHEAKWIATTNDHILADTQKVTNQIQSAYLKATLAEAQAQDAAQSANVATTGTRSTG